MAIFAQFFEHSNFNGDSESFNLTDNWRYYWIKFGSNLGNEITSFRGTSTNRPGNIYAFTHNDFLGDFASLNMSPGWTCWWSNVGGSLNDDIESVLMFNRNDNELTIALEDQVAGPFAEQFDDRLAGTPVSRRGSPKIYALYRPSHDPDRKFVSIEQELRVDVPNWFDYDARVRYDIYFYLFGNEIRAYVAWVYCWVEGGILSGKIFDDLHPQLVDGADALNDEIGNQLDLVNLLAALGGMQFGSLYLLPGNLPSMPPPSSRFGRQGNAKENCTLVLTRLD